VAACEREGDEPDKLCPFTVVAPRLQGMYNVTAW
jgi:hypothetical protein